MAVRERSGRMADDELHCDSKMLFEKFIFAISEAGDGPNFQVGLIEVLQSIEAAIPHMQLQKTPTNRVARPSPVAGTPQR